MMLLCPFQGKEIAENNIGAAAGAVSKHKKRQYRQYMNRKGEQDGYGMKFNVSVVSDPMLLAPAHFIHFSFCNFTFHRWI